MDCGLVLVAEDAEPIRLLIRTILEECGFEVVEACNGEEALEVARARQPDVVLMDIEMPLLDGFGALEQMQADDDLVLMPVVFLTGRDEAAAEGLDRGAHDFIRKPFDANDLVARVRAAIRVRRLQSGALLVHDCGPVEKSDVEILVGCAGTPGAAAREAAPPEAARSRRPP